MERVLGVVTLLKVRGWARVAYASRAGSLGVLFIFGRPSLERVWESRDVDQLSRGLGFPGRVVVNEISPDLC